MAEQKKRTLLEKRKNTASVAPDEQTLYKEKTGDIVFWCPPKEGIASIKPRPEKFENWIVIEGYNVGDITVTSQVKRNTSQYWTYRWHFLMPKEVMESLQHEWVAYESLASKVSETYAKLAGPVVEQVKGITSAFKKVGLDSKTLPNDFEKAIQKEGVAAGVGQTLLGQAQKFANTASSMGNVSMRNRVDTPLTYKASSRRQYELIFYLTAINDRWIDVVEPVRALQYVSSPRKIGSRKSATSGDMSSEANTAIEPPYIFKVFSEPDKFLLIENAIILQVNPVFRGPWIGGLPSNCELRVSVQEYDPLFDKNFYNNEKITVAMVDKEESTKK